jgi:hypothetical protein
VSERLIFWPLVAVTLLSPLPFGSVETWAWSALAGLTGLAMVAWCVAAAMNRELVAVPVRKFWLSAALFALALGWAGLQATSWLPSQWDHPIWAEASKALGSAISGSISINHFEAGSTVVRLLSYVGIFWITLQFARNRFTARRVLYVLLPRQVQRQRDDPVVRQAILSR